MTEVTVCEKCIGKVIFPAIVLGITLIVLSLTPALLSESTGYDNEKKREALLSEAISKTKDKITENKAVIQFLERRK